MSMVRPEENLDILDGYTLQAIDLRTDWQQLLQTIHDNKIIQQTMEKSYQDFQEGFKLKDFKYRNGIKGAWSRTLMKEYTPIPSLQQTGSLNMKKKNGRHRRQMMTMQQNLRLITQLKNVKK